MKYWEEKIFDNFVKLKRGYDLPEKNIIYGEYPVAASTSVKAYHKTYRAKPPCVVTGRSGSLGAVQYIVKKCWPLNTTLYVKEFKGNWPKFVYYFLQTMHLENYNSGAGVPTLNQNHLHKLKVKLPPLPIQKKITAVLSAYDDLIENNNRLIALLEKMAEEIYREWFVRMRFPGHEKVKFKKGVPVGWELKPFSKLVYKNPFLKTDKTGSKPYVGMQDLSTSSMIFSYKEYRKGNSGSKFQNGDVLFPRITPSLENGKRGFVMNLKDGEIGIGSTEFIVFRKKDLTSEFIYFISCTPEFRKNAELSMVGASGRQRVKEDCFDSFLIKTPPKNILEDFASITRPVFSKIKTIFLTNILLKDTRSLLLPRLISGKLSVEDLDIQFPKSMEDAGA